MNVPSTSLVRLDLSVPQPPETPTMGGSCVTETNTGRWTKTEHKLFLQALELYGKDWKKVQKHVGTRTTTQARSHAQKYFAKIGRANEPLDDPLPVSKVNVFVEPEEIQSTAQTYSPTKSVQSEESMSKNIPKKRLKGPFKPGRRPIKCDAVVSPLQSKRPKTEIQEVNEGGLDFSWENRPIPPSIQREDDFFLPEQDGELNQPVQEIPLSQVEFEEMEFRIKEPLVLPEYREERRNDYWTNEWDSKLDMGINLGGNFDDFFNGN